MPKFVIVRDIPGAGGMTADDLMAASQKSCSVLNKLGAEIQWIHPYVTDDKIYCIYTASNKDLIEEHARESGFPASRISEVRSMIDPTRAGS
ncbi:MAG: DUF4242 domain-containing protein [Pyrinomonadaceae bacterium]|jgi:hypothetical protein|nr:DUF4242 domain-containing protein [Blastocatellia bacterium]MCW5957157.1 DUF4242 domain-containing protein [Pyrinomonadaceae bacterium]